MFQNKNYENQNFYFIEALYLIQKNSHTFIWQRFTRLRKKKSAKNINTALLLDPKNEEALFMLIDLELERSNISK